MKAFPVVDLLPEVRETVDHILQRLVVVNIDLLLLERFEEALDLRVVVRVSPSRYRAAQPVLAKPRAVEARCISDAAVGVMDQPRRPPPALPARLPAL